MRSRQHLRRVYKSAETYSDFVRLEETRIPLSRILARMHDIRRARCTRRFQRLRMVFLPSGLSAGVQPSFDSLPFRKTLLRGSLGAGDVEEESFTWTGKELEVEAGANAD